MIIIEILEMKMEVSLRDSSLSELLRIVGELSIGYVEEMECKA